VKGKSLKFSKYSGNGNDFIILDRPESSLNPELLARLCDRNFGVGANGILVLNSYPDHDGEMRIFNADGGEAEMCGNGLRCLATYIDDKALIKKNSYLIKTMNHSYLVKKEDQQIFIEMSEIKDKNAFDLSLFSEFSKKFFVNTGVPHLILLGEEIKKLDLKKIAPFYRFHKIFPQGTNVNFVEILDAKSQSAYVRTFERGVEDETFSCGTGLTASALALNEWFGWSELIELQTKGGLQKVNLQEKVYYSGEVVRCFEGEFPL